jgi:signal transduction histidine kinase/ligand-binding sensor domain-containing protein
MASRLFFCMLLCLLPAGVRSQLLPLQSYTTLDGLPSNQINALFQDAFGTLWIGTNSGLSAFDGENFTNYSTADGLPNDWVTSISGSHSQPDVLWIGTIAGGICRFEAGGCIKIETAINEGTEIVSAVLEDSRGTVWSATVGGIYTYQNSESVYVMPRLAARYSNQLAETIKGDIWIGRRNMLTMIAADGSGWHDLELSPDSLVDVTAITELQNNHILVATSDRYIHEFKDTSLLVSHELNAGIAHAIAEDDDGILWMRSGFEVSRSRIVKGELTEIRRFAVDNPSPGGGEWSGPILIDREGILWIGTWADGLLKLTDKYSFRMPSVTAPKGYHIYNDRIFIFNPSGLTEIIEMPDGSFYNHIHSQFNPLDYGLIIDTWQNAAGADRMWMLNSEYSALYAFDIQIMPGEPSKFTQSQILRKGVHYSGNFHSMTVDSQNRLWIGSDIVEVVDLQTGKVLRKYTVSDGLPGSSIRALYYDPDGYIWAGDFDGGLSGLNVNKGLQEKFERMTTENGLPDNRIRAVFKDVEGTLWIGTRHGGLARYDHGGFTTVSVKDGLMSNSIWKIFDDHENRLWLFTDFGLECIDRYTLQVLPGKRIPGERPLYAGHLGGNYLFFASQTGMTFFDRSNEFKKKIPPLIRIRRVEVNGIDHSGPAELILTYTQNTIAFGFSGQSFIDERRIRHQYRLLGLDTTWSASTPQRSVTYASLRPGNYVFEAKAINADGLESDIHAAVKFQILRPFWLTWWFIALIASILIVVLWSGYRYQIRRVLEMERLRVRIASDLHDDVGTNLSSILILSQIMEKQSALPEQDLINLKDIGSIAVVTQGLLKDIVWMLNPKNDSLGDIIYKMKELAGRLLQNQQYKFHVPDGPLSFPVSIEFKRNVFLIFKEALNNIVRHASATIVVIEIRQKESHFQMKITDNGPGFEVNGIMPGNGLENMQRRAKQLGGFVQIESNPGKGTAIVLSVKNHTNR